MSARVIAKSIMLRSLIVLFGGVLTIILTVALAMAVMWAAVFYLDSFNDPTTVIPLKLPAGFDATVYAKGLDSPKLITHDQNGRILVYLAYKNEVIMLTDKSRKGISDGYEIVMKGQDAKNFFNNNINNSQDIQIPKIGWPSEYANNHLAIKTNKNNYSIVRVNDNNDVQPFISWNSGGGRPVSMLPYPDSGEYISDLYVSDDKAGVVYRITYKGSQAWKF